MPRFLRLLRLTTLLATVLALAAAATGASPALAATATENSPGPVLWTTPTPIDVTPINAVSCPSTQLCVAVDRDGRALWSTNPAGGARAWQAATVDPGNELTGISCPSTTLCVAVDAAGNAVTTQAPTAGATAWAVARIDTSSTENNTDTAGPVLLRGISCPSSSLCVAVDGVGNALSSTDPTGGAAAWTTTQADSNRSFGCSGAGLICQPPLVAVSCPSVALCAAADFSGNILVTRTPTASGPWPSTSADGGRLGSLWGISCPLVTFCATVDGNADHVITFDPAAPAAAQRRALPDALYGIWCGSPSLCLASAQTPNGISGLLGSFAPGAPRSTWSLSSLGAVNTLACPSPAVCVAADNEGEVAAGMTTRAAAALLRTTLLPTHRLPTIAALARTHRDALTLASPIAAQITLTWTLPGSQLLLAAASHRFTKAGSTRLTLRLTAAGVRVFRAATSRVTVTARATFVASTGSLSVTGTRTLTHPPKPKRPGAKPKPTRKRPTKRRR